MKKSYQSLTDFTNYKNNGLFFRFFSPNILLTSFLFFALFSTSVIAQEGDPVAGKALFNTNCAACHALDRKMTGPALRYVESRLLEDEGLDREWLNAWIRNSAAVIRDGDAYANKIYAEYNNAAMTAFPQLSDEDITNILAYTAQDPPPPPEAPAGAAAATEGGSGGISNELILGALVVLFVLLDSNYNLRYQVIKL